MLKLPKLYLQCKTYYFKYYKYPEIPDSKTRITVSTKTSDLKEAELFLINWMNEFEKKRRAARANPKPTYLSLRDILIPFASEESNPAMIHANQIGRNYSKRYARALALCIRRLGNLLKERYPALLTIPIVKISRRDCYEIIQIVREKYGNTYVSGNIEKAFKSVLSFAYKTGQIETNPAAMLERLPLKPQKKRDAICAKDVATLLDHPEIWPSYYGYCFFAIAALTGMRRGEIAALTREQLSKNGNNQILTIDRAYKDDSFKEVGRPKWEYIRVIPLCNKLEDIFDYLPKEGLLFPGINSNTITKWFKKAKLLMNELALEEPDLVQTISPHIMRHSLYTNLIGYGMSKIVACEYLSWEHQEDISYRYLHLKIKHLEKVADMIDYMYSKNEKEILYSFNK